ncbi:hypothetical protein [Acuticoccus sediminis]|uniref:hypothetical protein n=1 Tax=Acuticoccus sediminis TaxID=2184697 RepID=UPI0011B94A59|nr:hypothetical protein [Acuticoccus sediminis]
MREFETFEVGAQLPSGLDPPPERVPAAGDNQHTDRDAEVGVRLDVPIGPFEFSDQRRKALSDDRAASGDGDARALHDAGLCQRLDVGRQRRIAWPAIAEQLARRI